jgi:hypothetical protein
MSLVPFNINVAYAASESTPHRRYLKVSIVLHVYNTYFYYRLALDDGVVDCGSYARQYHTFSTSSFSQSRQSHDTEMEERLRCQDELINNLMQRQ